MTDRQFAREHRVTRPPTERPGLWVLAVVAAAPFVLAAAAAKWDIDWAYVAWAAVLLGLGALLVAMPAHWRKRTLLDVLARETAERAALEHELATAHEEARAERRKVAALNERVESAEQANERLHRAVDEAAGPCPVCAEREAS